MRVYEHEHDKLNDSDAGIVFAVDEEEEEEVYSRAEVMQLSSRHTFRDSIDEQSLANQNVPIQSRTGSIDS